MRIFSPLFASKEKEITLLSYHPGDIPLPTLRKETAYRIRTLNIREEEGRRPRLGGRKQLFFRKKGKEVYARLYFPLSSPAICEN